MLPVHCVRLLATGRFWHGGPSCQVKAVRRLSSSLPGETTILNFRHLLERHGLGKVLFGETAAHLALLEHRLKTGTIVDAHVIAAPSSTKTRRGERDLEMHRTRKGS